MHLALLLLYRPLEGHQLWRVPRHEGSRRAGRWALDGQRSKRVARAASVRKRQEASEVSERALHNAEARLGVSGHVLVWVQELARRVEGGELAVIARRHVRSAGRADKCLHLYSSDRSDGQVSVRLDKIILLLEKTD